MARRLRQKLPHVRIVIITSVYTGGHHKHEALRDFGVDEYMTKPIDGRLLADVLHRHLHSVHTFGTMTHARAAIAREPYDLYLLDIVVPDGNGLDMCAAIR